MLNWLGFAVPMQRRERTPHHKHHPQVPRKGPALLTQDERAGRSDIRATLATFEVELEGQIPTSLESLTLRQRRSTSAAASSTPKTTLSQAVRGQDVAVFANAGTIVQENNNVSIQTLVRRRHRYRAGPVDWRRADWCWTTGFPQMRSASASAVPALLAQHDEGFHTVAWTVSAQQRSRMFSPF
jgi:hypothetical protein